MSILPQATALEIGKAEVRVYMPFSLPVDIRRVETIPDLELSYALGSTLVEFDVDRQVSAYLAKSWKIMQPNKLDFSLAEKARWSDGRRITANDVVASFENTKREFGKDLVSLFDSIEKIDAVSDHVIRFHLKPNASVDSVLKKLTEPMYGIIGIDAGKYSATLTSGPFSLAKASSKSIYLKANQHWVRFKEELPKSIEIRPPTLVVTPFTLMEDSWPNLITTSSLVTKEEDDSLKRTFHMWHRNLDRVFLIADGGALKVDDLKNVIGYLKTKLDLDSLLKDLAGFRKATQIYPRGSELFRDELVVFDPVAAIPSNLKARPLKVLYSPSRVPKALAKSFEAHLRRLFPAGVILDAVDLNEIFNAIKSRKYDLYIGSVGADSANLDGALSYYIERDPPFIPSSDRGRGNFKARLKDARLGNQSQRDQLFKEIIWDSVALNHILPIFHYSTTAIARPELDLTGVPSTDETASLSKIKVKRGK